MQLTRKLSCSDRTFQYKLCLLNVLQKNSSPWKPEEIDSLLKAVTEGRLPLLEDLILCCGALKGYGIQLAEIMSKCKNLKRVNFMATDLSYSDGLEIIEAMKADSVTSIVSLNLLHCPGISALSDDFKAECQARQIDIDISQCPRANESGVPESAASGLMNMVSAFLPLISQATGTSPGTSTMSSGRPEQHVVQAAPGQAQGQIFDLSSFAQQFQQTQHQQQLNSNAQNMLDLANVMSSIFCQGVQSDNVPSSTNGKRNESVEGTEVPVH